MLSRMAMSIASVGMRVMSKKFGFCSRGVLTARPAYGMMRVNGLNGLWKSLAYGASDDNHSLSPPPIVRTTPADRR